MALNAQKRWNTARIMSFRVSPWRMVVLAEDSVERRCMSAHAPEA